MTGARIEQQHALARMHQQRLDAELEMIPREPGALERRGHIRRGLSNQEALSVVGLLQVAIF